VEGFIAIKAAGGLTIAQQPAQARNPSMPSSAIRDDSPDAVFRLEEIAAAIPLLAAGKAYDATRAA
jgi:chemotaxis response regulator CheB